MRALTQLYKFFTRIINYSILSAKRVSVDSHLSINGIVKIVGSGVNISIGDGTIINSGKRANPIGGAREQLCQRLPKVR